MCCMIHCIWYLKNWSVWSFGAEDNFCCCHNLSTMENLGTFLILTWVFEIQYVDRIKGVARHAFIDDIEISLRYWIQFSGQNGIDDRSIGKLFLRTQGLKEKPILSLSENFELHLLKKGCWLLVLENAIYSTPKWTRFQDFDCRYDSVDIKFFLCSTFICKFY